MGHHRPPRLSFAPCAHAQQCTPVVETAVPFLSNDEVRAVFQEFGGFPVPGDRAGTNFLSRRGSPLNAVKNTSARGLLNRHGRLLLRMAFEFVNGQTEHLGVGGRMQGITSIRQRETLVSRGIRSSLCVPFQCHPEDLAVEARAVLALVSGIITPTIRVFQAASGYPLVRADGTLCVRGRGCGFSTWADPQGLPRPQSVLHQ